MEQRPTYRAGFALDITLGVMNMSHLDPLRKQLRALRLTSPPTPWAKIAVLAVGGLRAVGFDRESDLLLVVSSAGRGVIDCQSGKKLARDDSDYYEDDQSLEAVGIGPLDGKTIRMSGLCGGGLSTCTSDGWSIEVVTLEWPINEVLLLEPFTSLYDTLRGKPSLFHRIASESELRAYGFSSSGRSLVVATSSDLLVFARNDA